LVNPSAGRERNFYNHNLSQENMPEVIFNGPDGRLEGRYHKAKNPEAPIAIVLHPNPLHGGNMNNRVVFILYNTFVEHGFSVLRFNFRGVGRSQGRFDNGFGELSDAAYAFDWIQQMNPNSPFCWIGATRSCRIASAIRGSASRVRG